MSNQSIDPDAPFPVTAALTAPLSDRAFSAIGPADRAMCRWADGDDTAFADVYEHLGPALRRYLRRKTGSDDRAEDLAQEVFIRMHAHRGNFHQGCFVKPWAFAIAVNQVRDEHKKKWRFRRIFDWGEPPCDVSDVTTPNAYEMTCAHEIERKLRCALMRLPESQRTAFELLQVEQLSQQEAADVMGVTLSAIKSLSHRAYCALRAELTRLHEGES